MKDNWRCEYKCMNGQGVTQAPELKNQRSETFTGRLVPYFSCSKINLIKISIINTILTKSFFFVINAMKYSSIHLNFFLVDIYKAGGIFHHKINLTFCLIQYITKINNQLKWVFTNINIIFFHSEQAEPVKIPWLNLNQPPKIKKTN